MQEKVTRIAVVLVLACVFAAEWMTGVFVTGNAFADQFLHANVFHLMLNCWAVKSIVRREIMHPAVLVAAGIFLGWLGFLCTDCVVGFSGALYAMLGIQWRMFGTRTNTIITAVIFAIGLVIPQVTFIAHAVPFFLGIAVGWTYNLIKRFDYETRKEQTRHKA